jgi:NTE family protein
VNRPRVGIALGSGSARGWAHIGVLQGLAMRGIVPDVIAGASVGALVGAAYAAGRLDDLDRWVRTLLQRDVWRLVDTTFRGGGVMTGNRLMQAIEAWIGNAPIESLPRSFAAVATDLYTGEEIWLREGPYMTAVRASSGLPGLFAPTWHDGRWLIDGGVVNPVPVSVCRALGAEFVIAVDLSRSVTRIAMRAQQREAQLQAQPHAPAEPSPHPEASAEGTAILRRWSGLVDGLVESFRSRRTEPGLLEVMASSVNIMQDRITRSRLATDPPDVVLRPDLAAFQLMDFHRADEAIDVGRRYVEQAGPALAALVATLSPGGTPS